MFKKIIIKVVCFLVPEYFAEFETRVKNAEAKAIDFELKVNQRVADYISRMDPFEPLLLKFHGVFSEEYDRPEDTLSERSKIQFLMWAYQQKTDPSFKFLTDFILNTTGNATLKKGNPTPETILYGRAQISSVILMKHEITRLSNLYEEILEKRKTGDIDIGITTE